MEKGPVSDEAISKATGRDWKEWCRLLDADGAAKMNHGEIARHVHDKYLADAGMSNPGWWSQSVTVGYERMRGLRAHHEKPGGFEISKSKTIDAPIARVYKAWHSAAVRRKWLADPDIDVSTATENKSMRFAWVDGKSRAQASFMDKGGKTAVVVTHYKLKDSKGAEKMKKYWGAQLDALAEHLGAV